MKDLFTSPRSILSIIVWIVIFAQVYQWQFFNELGLDYSLFLPQKHTYAMIFEGIRFAKIFTPLLFILFPIGFLLIILFRVKKELINDQMNWMYRNKFIRLVIIAISNFNIYFNVDRIILFLSKRNYNLKDLLKLFWNLEFLIFIISLVIAYCIKNKDLHWLLDYLFHFIPIYFIIKIFLKSPPMKYFISYKRLKVLILPIFFFILFAKLGTRMGKSFSNLDYERRYTELSFNYLNYPKKIETDSSFTLLVQTKDKIIIRDHCNNLNKIFNINDTHNLTIVDN